MNDRIPDEDWHIWSIGVPLEYFEVSSCFKRMMMPVPESWQMATLFSWVRVEDDLHKNQAGVEEIIPLVEWTGKK